MGKDRARGLVSPSRLSCLALLITDFPRRTSSSHAGLLVLLSPPWLSLSLEPTKADF